MSTTSGTNSSLKANDVLKRKNLLPCIVLCFGFLAPVTAQGEADSVPPLVTDRPDATEASSEVPKGTLQIETGGFYESFEENGLQSERSVYNTALLRYGLLENFELRLGWNLGEQQLKSNGAKVREGLNGLSPLLFGMKVAIAEERNGFPEIALIGHLFLPFTASDDFRPETTGADFRFSLSHTLSEKSSIGYNVGAQWGDDSPEIAYIYTLAYGYDITDRLGFFIEIYGDLPENSKANHLWDTGLTYLLRPNIQLDVSGGTSLTAGQDVLLSAGISFRIPK
ncbi:MAG TPA: transporter [Pricia sp.]|nr:transporter [Pricia sp.]